MNFDLIEKIKNFRTKNKLRNLRIKLDTVESISIDRNLNFYVLIKIENKVVKLYITKPALKSLLILLNFSNNNINKLLNNKYENEVSNKIIEIYQKISSKILNKDQLIYISINPEEVKIYNVSSKNLDLKGIPDNILFQNLENILEYNPNLVILEDYGISPNALRINVLDDKSDWTLQGFPDEKFKGGFTILQEYGKGTFFLPLTERTVCTNKMVGDWENGVCFVKPPNAADWEKFDLFFKNLKENKYVLPYFKEKIIDSMNTNCSYRELIELENIVKKCIKLENDELELFLPTKRVLNDYNEIGINLKEDVPFDKLCYVKTDINSWDILQDLTNLASHPEKHGYEDIDNLAKIKLQNELGIFFSKDRDLNIFIKNPYNL